MSVAVAVLVVALLLVGILAVPYRSMRPPEGYEQPRMHLNTKNSTRFDGGDTAEVGPWYY